MIRIVLVASTVILFLTFAVPVMLILERKNPLFRNFHLFSNKNANK